MRTVDLQIVTSQAVPFQIRPQFLFERTHRPSGRRGDRPSGRSYASFRSSAAWRRHVAHRDVGRPSPRNRPASPRSAARETQRARSAAPLPTTPGRYRRERAGITDRIDETCRRLRQRRRCRRAPARNPPPDEPELPPRDFPRAIADAIDGLQIRSLARCLSIFVVAKPNGGAAIVFHFGHELRCKRIAGKQVVPGSPKSALIVRELNGWKYVLQIPQKASTAGRVAS